MNDDFCYPLERFKTYRPPYPRLVFADNAFGLFALGVRTKTKGAYSHFMWEIGPGEIASQSLYFKKESLDHFRNYHLKFVSSLYWTDRDRSNLLAAIRSDLSLPWYSTLYDIVGVIGEFLGIDGLNIPGLNFCSERGSYLMIAEPHYNLVSPTPSKLNLWTKQSGRFEVDGRYAPDDETN
jgi:hypothetical protein